MIFRPPLFHLDLERLRAFPVHSFYLYNYSHSFIVMYKLIVALGLLPSVFAAEYTTTLLLVGFESQSIVGSVIATVGFSDLVCVGTDSDMKVGCDRDNLLADLRTRGGFLGLWHPPRLQLHSRTVNDALLNQRGKYRCWV